MKKLIYILRILPIILLGISAQTSAQTTTYSYTGAPQTYTVPPGVTSVTATLMGGGGGLNSVETYTTGCTWENFPDRGGYGGCVVCSLAVTPGDILYVYVGGKGTNGNESGCFIGTAGAGGWNGGGDGAYGYDQMAGGGGGGGSDIRMGGSLIANRVVVAGGGGGAALNSVGLTNYERGGDGGTTTGEDGWAAGSATIGLSGNGGGGAPAAGGGGGTCSGCYGLGGVSGTFAVGGDGGGCCAYGEGSSGGGGGGGWYGGGGGQWGGAGGGSSYADATLCTAVVMSRGCNTDTTNGDITITPNCTAGLITGNMNVCLPDTSTLSEDVAGGTWFSSNTAVATIGTNGLVNGLSVGTSVITYFLTISCGSVYATAVFSVHPHPGPVVVSSNSPLCVGALDTLKFSITPDTTADTFAWSGPNSFTDTVANATLPNFDFPDTGEYTVVVKTQWGCTDTGHAVVGLVAPPPMPAITGMPQYCQGATFIPFTVTAYTGSLLWFNTRSGGIGSTTALTVSTAIPGIYTIYVAQTIGSCQSPRDSFVTRIITTPAAPTVTGPMQYCQFIGPFVPLTVTTIGYADWYTTATGGTGSLSEPPVNINVAGTYNSWVNQTDSTCPGPRTPVTIVVHPKPNPPILTGQGPFCQYSVVGAITATASGVGDLVTYFGKGLGAGTTLAPTPQTDTARIDSYFVDEASVYGCISDSVVDTVRIIAKPPLPHVDDTTYCQFSQTVPANYQVDSARNSYLNWYVDAALIPVPTPSSIATGSYTWYVSQVVQTCQSDSLPVKATILLLPNFKINAAQNWICQYDSILLSYNGPAMQQPGYTWTLPAGDSFATKSSGVDSAVWIKFDSVNPNTFVYLRASDYNGFCATTDTVKLKIIAEPWAAITTKNDACIGDTVSLSLASTSDDALNFDWTVDYSSTLINSTALSMVAAGSGSGGPFTITWVDTGLHVVEVTTTTDEGCASLPSFDTINVHQTPDATFKMELIPNTLCIQDSVYFVANAANTPNSYNYAYTWSPAHSFTNVNQPSAWGRVEETNSVITLTVTNPFGCTASSSTELEPGSCCTVNFPNAFTPNGDSHNDFFRPLYTGYHNFHVFRIVNRWGQTMFETTSGDMKWDGTFNGVPQDMGVYFYYIKYDCGGKTIEESGDVTLIR